MNEPTATTFRQSVAGRGTKNTAGNTTSRNRSETSSSGGIPARPSSMTTKLMPHTTATRTASPLCRPDMLPTLAKLSAQGISMVSARCSSAKAASR